MSGDPIKTFKMIEKVVVLDFSTNWKFIVNISKTKSTYQLDVFTNKVTDIRN